LRIDGAESGIVAIGIARSIGRGLMAEHGCFNIAGTHGIDPQPFGASSSAKALVSSTTPPFEAQ
jgi:hypothetical protein